jgi:DNA primase
MKQVNEPTKRLPSAVTLQKPDWLDEKVYREQVQRRLFSVQTRSIQFGISISQPYALRIREGRCVPHPRHWLNLAQLTGGLP